MLSKKDIRPAASVEDDMYDRVEINYEKTEILDYQKSILNGELCSLFLPVNFLCDDKRISGIYRTQGFVCLKDVERLTASDALDIFTELLKAMMEAEKRYILIGDYSLAEEHLYVDTNTRTVKLTFGKGTGNDKTIILNELGDILKLCKEKVEEPGDGYLDKAADIVARRHSSFGIIRHRIEELRREAFTCGY